MGRKIFNQQSQCLGDIIEVEIGSDVVVRLAEPSFHEISEVTKLSGLNESEKTLALLSSIIVDENNALIFDRHDHEVIAKTFPPRVIYILSKEVAKLTQADDAEVELAAGK